tara:strand:- start:73 stop:264 length:192 start_codon:yes stop_codon:yes gene_type:complete
MAERKVEILLDAIEKFDDQLNSEKEKNLSSIKKINALDLIGSSNTAIISLGSQDYILRLTRQN